jgi:hypothetical protein
MSLAVARGKAVEAKGHVNLGEDTRLVLAGQATAGMTVAALAEAYLADPEKASLRSSAEIGGGLRRNVVPVIGAVKLAELRRRVRSVTDAMLRRGVKVEGDPRFRGRSRRWSVGRTARIPRRRRSTA